MAKEHLSEWKGFYEAVNPYGPYYQHWAEFTMKVANFVLGTHGVEGGDAGLGYRTGRCYEYCNRGDTYDCTVLYDPHKGKITLMSWGDYQEWLEREGHVSSEY